MEILFDQIEVQWRSVGSRKELWDPCRKRWVALTPEEWVRQHLVRYLIEQKRYPASLMAIERELTIIDKRRRFDILVYDQNQRPWLMVECKAQDVVLDRSVLDQILQYNIGIPVPYLVITNGNQTLGFKRTQMGLESLSDLPSWT